MERFTSSLLSFFIVIPFPFDSIFIFPQNISNPVASIPSDKEMILIFGQKSFSYSPTLNIFFVTIPFPLKDIISNCPFPNQI